MKSDGMYAALDASARVECERWAHELLYDGWFSRDDHHALNESLVALLCCYPNVPLSAVPRNRERIQAAIVDVVCEDVPCRESDLPDDVRKAFQTYVDKAEKSLSATQPLTQGAKYLAIWNQKFPGKWRPEPEDGQQLFWRGQTYSCWINAKGRSRWTQPRFMPGRDYDGAFRGIEFSKRCSLDMVRAIAEHRGTRSGPMLNPELAAALTRTAGETNVTADGSAKTTARRGRSDADLLKILADGKELARADHARRLGISMRQLRKVLAQATALESRLSKSNRWASPVGSKA